MQFCFFGLIALHYCPFLTALLSQAARLPTVPETLLKKRRLQQSLKEKKAKAREAAFAVSIAKLFGSCVTLHTDPAMYLH